MSRQGEKWGWSAAEVRISAGTNEHSRQAHPRRFRDLRIQRVSHSETLQVSVAFAVLEQAFEEF